MLEGQERTELPEALGGAIVPRQEVVCKKLAQKRSKRPRGQAANKSMKCLRRNYFVCPVIDQKIGGVEGKQAHERKSRFLVWAEGSREQNTCRKPNSAGRWKGKKN